MKRKKTPRPRAEDAKAKARTASPLRFLLVALLLPVALLVLAELGMRLTGVGSDLALFVPAPAGFADRDLLRVNPEVARRYFTEDRFVPRPLRDFFARRKPANGFRLFVLGESATAGFPYPGNVAFSRILQGRLADAWPEREIEVVNVALTATNTHTMLDFIDEILSRQPDAILIYAGHNEFYGALGAASTISLGDSPSRLRLYLALRRLRMFQLVESALNRLKGDTVAPAANDARAEAGLGLTLMGRMSGKADIVLDGPVYRNARAQFEANLKVILGKAKDAAVPVLLSELVSNQRDQPPFASAAAAPRADDVFREARELEGAGRFEEARAAYARAQDLDVLRFRAPGEFNEIIRHLAGEFGQTLVPMRTVFEAASPHGIVGASLMLEHLHPNVDGQFLMSEAFLDALRARGLPAGAGAAAQKPLAWYREHWPVSAMDRAIGVIRIRQLTDYWPFKPQAEAGRQWSGFQPQGLAEFYAHVFVTRRMRLPEARMTLARRYEADGLSDAALRELRSLAADGLWDHQAQLVAAQQLIEAGHPASAVPFLQASLRLKETAYAREWIGRIGAESSQVAPAARN